MFFSKRHILTSLDCGLLPHMGILISFIGISMYSNSGAPFSQENCLSECRLWCRSLLITSNFPSDTSWLNLLELSQGMLLEPRTGRRGQADSLTEVSCNKQNINISLRTDFFLKKNINSEVKWAQYKHSKLRIIPDYSLRIEFQQFPNKMNCVRAIMEIRNISNT